MRDRGTLRHVGRAGIGLLSMGETGQMDREDLSALTSRAGAVGTRESLGVMSTGRPVVVDVADAAGLTPAAGQQIELALRTVAAPVLAVGAPAGAPVWLVQAADACVTLHPDPPSPWLTADPAPFVEAVSAHPLAALALVRLLRATTTLDVPDAIAAEAATYAALLGSSDHQRWRSENDLAHRAATDEEPVVLTRSASELRVELNRPHVRNAVDSAVRDALVGAFDLAESEPSLSVELSGRGPDFCAGGDLGEFGLVPDPAAAMAVRATRHPGASADRVADQLTVHLHGRCIGAGIEIAAFARRVTAADGTTARLPELSMGLIPGAGGTVSLPRRIGRHRTAWLAITGTEIDARTAQAWGLIDALD